MIKRIEWKDLRELAATVPPVKKEIEEKSKGILYEIHVLARRYSDIAA